MSPRIWRARLQDILEAITEIQAFTVGMNFETFAADKKTMRAVELDLIVIGEVATDSGSH